MEGLRGKVDLVAGGPPCQGFSMAGKRVEDDIRNNLVFSYIKFIDLVRPKIILFENVKGFTYAFDKKKNGDAIPYSQKVIKGLKGLGYNVKPHIIDFSKYGVPQRRNRFILVGVQKSIGTPDKFKSMLDSYKDSFLQKKGLTVNTTLREAISDLLQSNGEIPTPDRKGFKSGIYGIEESNYQKLLRGDYTESHIVPDSHSFAKHTEEKSICYKKLIG